MKLGLDLDDVIIDINRSIREFLKDVYGLSVTLEDHKTFDFHTTWECTPTEAMNRVFEFYESDYMNDIPPIPGSIEAVTSLLDNHEIHFVTSRPHAIEEKTRHWVNTHFPHHSPSIHHTNQFTPAGNPKVNKSDVLKDLGISIMVEDSPYNIQDISSNNIHVLMYTRPWNQNVEASEHITRVNDWNDVLRFIKNYS